MWNEETGEVERRPQRTGPPVPRVRGTKTPCYKCPKTAHIPDPADRVRANAIELSDRNRRAYRHFRECRAVGSFPDDPIVRRNAAIIDELLEAHRQVPMLKLAAWFEVLTVRKR